MNINEDLRKWVAEKWVDIGAPKKGGGYKPCGRQKGEKRKGYPKCVPLAKARSMSKGQRRSAVKRKRAAGNAGPTPTNVSTFSRKNESMNTYDRVYGLLLEKVMPDTYKKMGAARKAMGKKAAKLFAKSKKPTAPGEERSLAGAAIKAVKAGKTAKKKQKFAHDVEKYKRKETVDDSIERIGDLITEVRIRGTTSKDHPLVNWLKAGVMTAAALKGANDRYIQPYGHSDDVRYDLKNPTPESRTEKFRRNIQGDDYVDDWDIQAFRRLRNKLGTRNSDQDFVWKAHDLVTGRDREKELRTREKLKPSLFGYNKAVARTLAGVKANPTPRSGINPQMLYQREQTELTESFDRINTLITEVAAWQRKEGKNPSGGLNKKGVESYRRENPGSKLKTAVTTKPSKLKKGSKAASRRKSFCARMGGMKKRRTSAKTANDPNSRINKALRKWNC